MTEWLCGLSSKLCDRDDGMLHMWPNSIMQQYNQLIRLAKDGNLYGVMLQTKDLFEEIIKLPTVIALIVLDNIEKIGKNDEYLNVIRKLLSQPMTLGAWYTLALHIVKKRKELSLPESLAEILKKTTLLFQQPITDEISDIVNWRNNSIGHGALRFSESESYREEIETIFHLLSDYVTGNSRLSINDLYGHIILNLDLTEDSLVIDGVTYKFGHFATETDARTYLFESYYSNKKLTRFRADTGRQFSLKMQYFDDLFQMCFRQNKSEEKIRADFITRENDMLLEFLYSPETYIKPKYVVDKLQSVMEDMGKGVILIRMERGMGKTAFASRLDGLYTSRKECLLPNAVIRCYHVSNVDLKGLEDFYHSFNYSFKHSYSHTEDIRESGAVSVDISGLSKTVASDVAMALGKYHEWYNREYTAFVIDGIDEMSIKSEEILRSIPERESMNDGTFVLLLSRFADESTVDRLAIRYIMKAEALADRIIDFRRNTPEYTELLRKYIYACNPSVFSESVDNTIQKADYRMLFVKPYMALPEGTKSVENETDLIKLYYDRLSLYQNDKQLDMLVRVSLIIALFHSVSVDEMNQYLDCFDITYQNIGLLNDLKPLMTVSHVHGNTYYSFASIAYEKYVLDRYCEKLPTIICDLVSCIVQQTESVRQCGTQITHYTIEDYERVENDGSSLALEQMRTSLYRRCYFYVCAISNIYRFSETREQIWDVITTETTMDAIIVFLGILHLDYNDLYGFGASEQSSDPYEFFHSLLSDYICGDLPAYIQRSITRYIDWLLTDFDCKKAPKTSKHRGYDRYFFLSACAGYKKCEPNGLIHLIIREAENGKDISEYFWLICFLGFHNETEVCDVLNKVGLLDRFVKYKLNILELTDVDDLPFTNNMLETVIGQGYKLDKDSEEYILNYLLKKPLEEAKRGSLTLRENVRYARRLRADIVKHYKEIKDRGYHINDDNTALLCELLPGIETECDQQKKVSVLCERIGINLSKIEQCDDCHEISELVDYLFHNTSEEESTESVVEILLQIYDRALIAAEKKELISFAKWAGFRYIDELSTMLLICERYKVFKSNTTIWGMWLQKLQEHVVQFRREFPGYPVDKLRNLLLELQRRQMFSEDDPTWLRVMEFSVEELETPRFIIELYIYALKQIDYASDRLFCTNNTIKLVDVYLKHDVYRDKAINLLSRLKEDIPFIIQTYGEDPEIRRRLECNLIRYEYMIEQHKDKTLLQYLPFGVYQNHANDTLYEIVDHVDLYHKASDLTDPVIHIFDYYYERELFHEAIDLCTNALNELRKSYIGKENQDSIELQLAVSIDLIKSLFICISENENEINTPSLGFDIEHITRSRVFAGGINGSEDGLTRAIKDYRFDLLSDKKKLKPDKYKNNYMISFFAGNGMNQIGPNYNVR